MSSSVHQNVALCGNRLTDESFGLDLESSSKQCRSQDQSAAVVASDLGIHHQKEPPK